MAGQPLRTREAAAETAVHGEQVAVGVEEVEDAVMVVAVVVRSSIRTRPLGTVPTRKRTRAESDKEAPTARPQEVVLFNSELETIDIFVVKHPEAMCTSRSIYGLVQWRR